MSLLYAYNYISKYILYYIQLSFQKYIIKFLIYNIFGVLLIYNINLNKHDKRKNYISKYITHISKYITYSKNRATTR